jgi:putative FmdB family regulatory protein
VPTYEYACTACDERLEVVQKFTDATLTECPVCGGQLRKVFSPVGVVFKGSGFYKTDSRGSSKHGSSSKSDNAKGESKSETKSDSTASSSTTSSTPAAASTSSSSSTPSAAAAS